jgi:plasmid maintenance system antidote protein VapI
MHSGALMREIVEEQVKMPIAEASRRMKVSRQPPHPVPNGTTTVTAKMALRFARLTGGAPELYIGYYFEMARQRLKDALAKIAPVPQHHPSAAISTGKSNSAR